jgi:hypothetical protein
MSDRQKLFFALLVSAFIHVVIGVVLANWSTDHSAEVTPHKPADLSQLTVTIMQKPAPPAPPKPQPVIAAVPTPPPARMKRPVLDSDGLTPSEKAPAHALFQSDANMVAGSQLPATGNIPLPSEAGPHRNFEDFANIPASMGKGEAPSAPSTRPQVQPAPASMPEQTPFAVTKVQRSPSLTNPQPTPTPAPTPAPDTLALGTPTPTPSPPSQLPTPIAELAKLSTPPPLRAHAEMPPETQSNPPSPEPSTQRETEKTRIDGGITTPGRPGVDAVETPYGRYHRKLSNLIGSRWQLYLQEHPKDVGDVTIEVVLDPSGKVTTTRVISNHSMDDLAELSTRAIMESDLPPVPDDLAPMLRNGKLEITLKFDVYDPDNDSPGR